jgi:hypothetical protein
VARDGWTTQRSKGLGYRGGSGAECIGPAGTTTKGRVVQAYAVVRMLAVDSMRVKH